MSDNNFESSITKNIRNSQTSNSTAVMVARTGGQVCSFCCRLYLGLSVCLSKQGVFKDFFYKQSKVFRMSVFR